MVSRFRVIWNVALFFHPNFSHPSFLRPSAFLSLIFIVPFFFSSLANVVVAMAASCTAQLVRGNWLADFWLRWKVKAGKTASKIQENAEKLCQNRWKRKVIECFPLNYNKGSVDEPEAQTPECLLRGYSLEQISATDDSDEMADSLCYARVCARFLL